MRLTLEQLKAMSDKELYRHWRTWEFPFDMPRGSCRACLTGHSFEYVQYCGHTEFHEQIVREISLNHGVSSAADLRPWLEQIYALRLFYDSLYPQPAPEPEQAVATQPISAEVLQQKP